MAQNIPGLDNLSIGLTAFNTNEEAINLFERINLIITRDDCRQLAHCPDCDSRMRPENSREFKLGWRMRCTNKQCRKSCNPLEGTFFEKTILDWVQILSLAYCFVAKGHYSLGTASEIAGCVGKTVVEWWFFMREVCTNYIERNPIRIGGPGIRVMIDETHLYYSMYGRGREPRDVWVVGGIAAEQEPNEELQFFATRVEDTTGLTIDALIRRHVVGGSHLMTDGAAVYQTIMNRIGQFSAANPNGLGDHSWVNHSQAEYAVRHYIRRDNNGIVERDQFVVTTNNLEIRWRWFKANIGSIREFDDEAGNHIHYVDGYIDRYVYLCRVINNLPNNGRRLERFLRDVQTLYLKTAGVAFGHLNSDTEIDFDN